jgi:release factor glutamine methyltransferase
MKIEEILYKYSKILSEKGFSSPNLDVELILCYLLKIDKSQLFIQNDRKLDKIETKEFEKLFKRRLKHEPIAYIIKEKEFYNRKFKVDKSVMIPRPLTEELIELVLGSAGNLYNKNINVLDVGTGSGCILVTLYKELKKCCSTVSISPFAVDISSSALDIARYNFEKFGLGNVRIKKGDLATFGLTKFDIIVANLPYIKKGSLDFSDDSVLDLKFEPNSALYASYDGFAVIQKALKKYLRKLKKSGTLFLEVGRGHYNKINELYGKKYEIRSFFDDRIIMMRRSQEE